MRAKRTQVRPDQARGAGLHRPAWWLSFASGVASFVLGLVVVGSQLAAAQTGRPLDPVMFDKDEPIEIAADLLDVDQQAKTATFAGNVDAIQGDFRLRADQLTVHYEGDAGLGHEEVDSEDRMGGRIKRMEVVGNVHVSSLTETATGQEAVYDLDRGAIDLVGDVVLQRGDNVIRGTKLTIDVESGRSVIVGAPSVDGGSGRVRGLFVPKKDQGAPGSQDQ